MKLFDGSNILSNFNKNYLKMLHNLHHITRNVLLHSEANWSTPELPKHFPDNKDTLAFIEGCYQQQFQWHEQMLNRQITATAVQDKLCHLLVFKQRLDEVPWPEPDHLTGLALQWYTHDLLVSLGLSYLLQTGVQLFKGFCDDKDLPSQSIISPATISPLLRRLPGFSEAHAEIHWIHRTLGHQAPLQTELTRLQHIMQKNYLPKVFIRATQMSIDHLTAHLPTALVQEQFYYHELIKMTHHEIRSEDSLVIWRKLLLLNLTLFNPDTEVAIQLHSDYRCMLEQELSTAQEWESESHYWQTHYLLYTETMPDTLQHKPTCLQWMDNLMQFCLKQLEIQTSHRTLPFTRIDWGKSPKDFVNLFHSLISNKTITLNGNSDYGPFCEVLYRIFQIPKVRGNGYLSLPSLMTYFKNKNCGDF